MSFEYVACSVLVIYLLASQLSLMPCLRHVLYANLLREGPVTVTGTVSNFGSCELLHRPESHQSGQQTATSLSIDPSLDQLITVHLT
jgi:hypothetical protein